MPADPTVRKVISLSDMRKLECAKLRLSVNDRKLRWDFWPDNRGSTDGEYVNLTFSKSDRQLIEMLSDVQQLLIELRPEDGAHRDAVNAKLFRVAAELGDRLFGVLFQDADVRKSLDEGLKGRSAGTHLFRIELEFTGDGAFMAAWPWEYLHLPGEPGKPESGTFLAHTSNLVLNRLLRDKLGEKFSTRKPTLLLVVARPHTREPGPVHCEHVIGVMDQLQDENVVCLQKLIEPPADGLQEHFHPQATWSAFKEHVQRHRPQIIHFIGHGQLIYKDDKNVGQLAFVGAGGEPDWIDEEDFAQAVNHPELRLVFLQACESGRSDRRVEGAGIANSLISKKVPAVVAMQAKVHNLVADTFAQTVYSHLKAGLPIDFAVMRGREAIKELQDLKASEKKFFFGVPIVYLGSHQGLIDTTEIDVKPESQARSTASRSSPAPADAPALKCPECDAVISSSRGTYCANCGIRLLCKVKQQNGEFTGCGERLIAPTFAKSYCTECSELLPECKRRQSQEQAADVARDGAISNSTLLKDKTKEAPTPGGHLPVPPPRDTGG